MSSVDISNLENIALGEFPRETQSINNQIARGSRSKMQINRMINISGGILVLSMVLGVVSVAGASTTSLPLNLLPLTTTISYDYDYLTGILTPGTLTATDLAFGNMIFTVVADPSPHSNGGGTFFGTGRPVNFQGDEVVYTASVCTPFPSCSSSLTFGGFVVNHHFNAPLSSLTTIASQFYLPSTSGGTGSDCAVGSPRFSLTTSLGANKNIFVYLGELPTGSYPTGQGGCTKDTWTGENSGMNLATASAGLVWDTSQLCTGTQLNTYAGAVSCADGLGATINAIFVVIDGGYNAIATGGSGTQIVYFRSLQVNSETRFP